MVKSRNLVDGHIQDVCSIPMFQKFVVEEIYLKFLPVLILKYDQSNAPLLYIMNIVTIKGMKPIIYQLRCH